ncbi:murein L,D-transpeptidase [Paracoccus sediminis]|uniref:Lipoprotein-anchoring transpeptidase ErfK/SrfK n=1 Tax=Paracoccus sediminis TaxID=1214787 RepID=A0A238W489_9RHOB|nr:L,D-transpeptidase [Paracoccus sediminis]TBN51545.1 murein L,D-transpeptidase [Paracoccus sediminis]SNR41144.1 Lipoprotein-anchoring transpeptidase ErfK/SrfK [Paracoccus sediminis]
MPRLARFPLVLMLASVTALPVAAQTNRQFLAADVEAATYGGGDLPSGRSALTTKVQVLLDRSGISPGVIDGFKGGMSQSAIMAFERRSGLPIDGAMDPHVWNLLQSFAAQPATQDYTITPEDAQGLVDSIPADYAEKAQMKTLAHTSVAERLGERFHMDEKFIAFLNPGVDLIPGATIKVINPGSQMRGTVARILVDVNTRRVAGFDANGQLLVDFPATIGSSATPSPSGNHHVATIALNPNYTYDPRKNFQQGDNDKPLVVPPGPNGPVGTVWIGLSKPSYGIHGTPTPSQLFQNQSMGCVRLTNWDAEELAHMVRIDGTTVEFLPAGVTIADATGVAPAPAAPAEPLAVPDTAVPDTAVPDATTPAPPVATATADQPLDYDPLAATPQPVEPVFENTSEEEADALAPQPDPQADPLTDALTGALPDGFVVPPADVQP